jgi:hypothetical protein
MRDISLHFSLDECDALRAQLQEKRRIFKLPSSKKAPL